MGVLVLSNTYRYTFLLTWKESQWLPLVPSTFQVYVQLILTTILWSRCCFYPQTQLGKLGHTYRNLHEVTYPERAKSRIQAQVDRLLACTLYTMLCSFLLIVTMKMKHMVMMSPGAKCSICHISFIFLQQHYHLMVVSLCHSCAWWN